jgi:hypothetical protein
MSANAGITTVNFRLVQPRRNPETAWTVSQLLMMLQQAPIDSVKECADRRFPRRFASFSPTLPPGRPGRSIWRLVAGQMGSFALDAGREDPTNW